MSLSPLLGAVSSLIQCSHYSFSIQMMTLLEDCCSSAGYIMDIIKELAKEFKDDLTPRKSCIKLMIQNELTRIAAAIDEGEEEAK
ncbi:unnamed protein product [Brassica rapa]|uniref:Uncharacterized protein n=1 Tax=Brassica campestris TaxID=3711 RepID=A0A8D9LUQ2_BRACM|nr:unnamed protein product [Brassica rapa]